MTNHGGSSRAFSRRTRFATGSGLAAALLTSVALNATPTAAATSCAGLASLSIPNGTITSATLMPASGATPAYCNVLASVAPETNIQVQLPNNWQHRYLHLGGAGFDGSIPTSAPAANNVNLLAAGYAVGASNGGHEGTLFPGASFAGNQTLVLGYAYTAIGQTDVVAQAVIRAYYGQPARYRYFDGCSNGGKNASIAASKYRANYDGVIGGDGVYGHARDHVGGADMAGLTAVWAREVDLIAPLSDSATLSGKLTALYNAEVAQCDGADGLLDGIISNPSACHFDPAILTCPGSTNTASCLTPAEVSAIKTIMSDLVRDGEVIGAPFGLGNLAGPLGSLAGGAQVLGQGFLAMAYNNPSYPISSFNVQTDFPFIDKQLDDVDDMDGPLGEIADYVRSGNKLILWMGGEDPLIPTADSIRFVGRLLQVLDPRSANNVRLFSLPGVGHCGFGPGASALDLLTPITNWVERGIPPNNLIASNVSGTVVNFTRPICSYPLWPKYNGEGNGNDASSFTCVPPSDEGERGKPWSVWSGPWPGPGR
jgi:feruloyl esterase